MGRIAAESSPNCPAPAVEVAPFGRIFVFRVRFGRDLPILKGVIDLDGLLAQHDGLLLAREHRRRKSSLSRWCLAGRIARILPGVYVAPAALTDPETKVRAALARIPGAVLAGAAAAKLTAWPQERVASVVVLVPSRRVPKPGFRFVRRQVEPAEVLHRSGLCVLRPTAIAVDSAAHDQGSRIDDLLRQGWPLAQLRAAFAAAPGRVGNPVRRRVLQRSRSLPWSQAERRLHDLLDRHRIRGWRANRPVFAAGTNYFLDIALDASQLAVEVDGYEFHSSRRAFEADRRRANDLAQAGWRMLRLTWEMLAEEEQVVAWIRALSRPPGQRPARLAAGKPRASPNRRRLLE